MRLTVPCLCGAIGRVRIDSNDAIYRMPDRPGLPRFDRFKDWHVKYLQLSWNVAQLERAYVCERDAVVVQHLVEMVLASSARLADWLMSGPEPHEVTPADIDRFMDSDLLRICAAAADRHDGEYTKLVPVAFAPTPHFWVEYNKSGQKSVRFDALDFAERCLHAWQQFLTGYDVPLPRWEP
jgi:hypothetical protein